LRVASHSAHISVEIFDLDADLFVLFIALLLVVSNLPEGVFDLGFESRHRFLHLVYVILSFLWLLLKK
jgi:hypothetical protein